MVNRSIESKKLKMKRRNRFAVFSGATTKYMSRSAEVLENIGEDKVHVKRVEVLVGKVSFSKQVMNTGRGPSAERMAEYYNRVKPESFQTTLPEDLGIKDIRYNQIWDDTDKDHHILLVSNSLGRLSLYFNKDRWFFVDVDYHKKVVRRSRVYGSKAFAMGRLHNKMVTWVETLLLK